jgi:hypothetical protein
MKRRKKKASKTTGRRKTARKSTARKKTARKPAPARRKAKTRASKTRPRTVVRKKAAARRTPAARTRSATPPRKKARRPKSAGASTERPRALPDQGWRRGMGAEAAGQSGDTEAISRSEVADSERVEELLEEGQSYEAGIVDAVENAPDADEGEIRTREVPEDDVPEEYRDRD